MGIGIGSIGIVRYWGIGIVTRQVSVIVSKYRFQKQSFLIPLE